MLINARYVVISINDYYYYYYYYEEIKGVSSSKDKAKHNERNDHLFLEGMMTVAEQ